MPDSLSFCLRKKLKELDEREREAEREVDAEEHELLCVAFRDSSHPFVDFN